MKMFAVYDKAIEGFMTPFFLQAKGEAVRGFIDSMDQDTPLAKHPEDFQLWYLGDFDPVSGEVTNDHGPEKIITGLDVIGNKEEKELPAIDNPIGN